MATGGRKTIPKAQGNRSQRRIRNLLLDPARQLRSVWLFVWLCVLYSIGIGLVFSNTLYQQHAFVMEYLGDSNTARFIDMFQNPIVVSGLVQAVALLLVFLLSVFVVTVLFTHRVFGPLIPIKRQVEAMRSGDYSKRISLRKKDELKDLAEAINRLTEQLEDNAQRAAKTEDPDVVVLNDT